ncbi:MAG: hypothetical protein U1F54_13655 [Burkholderiales bacterium]
MKTPPDTHPVVRAEQLRYARILDVTSRTGFVALLAGFAAYAMGWLDLHVPVEDLPRMWSLPLAQYLERTQSPTGWGWLAHLHKGEYLGLLGIAILAGCSILCLAAIAPLYAKRKDTVFVVLCLLEITVLLVAASGVMMIAH